jgi:hypothetical protein
MSPFHFLCYKQLQVVPSTPWTSSSTATFLQASPPLRSVRDAFISVSSSHTPGCFPDTWPRRSFRRSSSNSLRPTGFPEEAAGYLAGCFGAGAACGGGAAAGAGAAGCTTMTWAGAGAGAGADFAEPAAAPTAKAAPRPRIACASGTRFSDRYGAIDIRKRIATAPAILHICFMVSLLLISAF